MKKEKNRFKVVYKKGVFTGFKVIVDQETGVNYLFCIEGYAAGLTVLLDSDGKPVVTPIDTKKKEIEFDFE